MPSDWIETFVDFTSGTRSPESFRLWSGISAIAAVLERRVWTVTDKGLLYPNTFNILAGVPASGKTLMVNQVRKLLIAVKGLHLAPDNPTKASFLDTLDSATRISRAGGMFCAMTALCREFNVLVPKYDIAFLADLTDLYDNPSIYTAPRRTTRSIAIGDPTINILAAATPDTLGDTIPEAAWGQGFTSRLVFIYGARVDDPTRRIFQRRTDVDFAPLVTLLNEWFNDLEGEVEWEVEAQDAVEQWVIVEGMAPVPDYGRLLHYVSRREAHLLKLCMISAVSGGRGRTVTLKDFTRAKQWLIDAEEAMPNVFRAMAQRSDKQLLADLHMEVYAKYASQPRDKRLPIRSEVIEGFLSDRVPGERVKVLFDLAVRTGRIRRGELPDEWIPRPLDSVIEL